MSASDKKKLHKEQRNELLTEKQRKQQAEDKKLRISSIAFVTAMALVVCIAVGVLVVRGIKNSGIIEKNTIAATFGDVELSSPELSYYYHDGVGEFYNEMYELYDTNTDSYLQMMGLEPTLPLDEQMYDEENNITWADHFVDSAIESAKSDRLLYDMAQAEGFTLPDDDQVELDNLVHNLETYATLYGYSNADVYIRAMYGYGADADSYTEYCKRSAMADAYAAAHQEGLTYDNDAIRAFEADKYNDYTTYIYTSAYISYTAFREGGTVNEDDTVTYSDEEEQAARTAAKAAADSLAAATSVAELKDLAKAVVTTDESQITVTESQRVMGTSLTEILEDWLTSEDRKEGDVTVIENTTTTTDAEGNEVTKINGYYVLYFHKRDDNTAPMSNVRHLLVNFTGGTEDEESGETVYSEQDKADTKAIAEGYLNTWKEGEATEDSFVALVTEHSEDEGSASTGGLYEDIHPDSNYVENFLNWAIDPERKAGDTGIVETEYGYHVMYYVGDSDMSYRDYMITEEMRTADQETWYNGIVESVTAAKGDLSKLELGITLSSGN